MAVFSEVARLAARTRRPFDADDIAGEVALAVADRPATIMVGYPDPAHYARQRVRHAGISFDRRERVQRGEGARLVVGSDGLQGPGRRYESADAWEGGGNLLAHATPRVESLDAIVADRLATGALLQRACEGLSPVEFRELWLVDGCGYTVQEVAELCGQRRETVSRRLSATRRRVRSHHLTTPPLRGTIEDRLPRRVGQAADAGLGIGIGTGTGIAIQVVHQ